MLLNKGFCGLFDLEAQEEYYSRYEAGRAFFTKQTKTYERSRLRKRDTIRNEACELAIATPGYCLYNYRGLDFYRYRYLPRSIRLHLQQTPQLYRLNLPSLLAGHNRQNLCQSKN